MKYIGVVFMVIGFIMIVGGIVGGVHESGKINNFILNCQNEGGLVLRGYKSSGSFYNAHIFCTKGIEYKE